MGRSFIIIVYLFICCNKFILSTDNRINNNDTSILSLKEVDIYTHYSYLFILTIIISL